jgi:DNA repair protein RecN (Recombination protein N)
MLERLRIRDLVLVERAEVEFGPGLTVVTGETGAGKSLLVQAVDLLVGGRADADAIREGAQAAHVEGEFQLAGEPARRVAALLGAWGVPFDGTTLVVRRELLTSRSRALVNDTAVTQRSLRELGEVLADLHGQHEHQSLLADDAGREVVDRLGQTAVLRERHGEALARARTAAGALESLERSLATLEERRDLLEHAAEELDEARLVAGEEERLASDAARLAHADRLRGFVSQALDRLVDGAAPALDALAQAERAIEQAGAIDPGLAATRPQLTDARIAAAEAARALADYASRLEADPEALELVEARRALIAGLARRYRRAVPELIAWRAEIAAELSAGDDAEGTLARARDDAARAREAALATARALSQARGAAAHEWSRRLTRELHPLGFPEARLDLEVTPDEGRLGPHGIDEVTMQFAPNPGEPARPLPRIASGGELSRVMLALKTALERRDPVDLLLFDEVDSGIGGAVARAVGERLRRLSRHRQIVCVTHLPLIAALASRHLRVTKQVAGGRTVARIEAVEGRERVEELARMLAGDRITETTRRQARELLATPS